MDSESTLNINEQDGPKHCRKTRQLSTTSTSQSTGTRIIHSKETQLSMPPASEVISPKTASDRLFQQLVGKAFLTGAKETAWSWFLLVYLDRRIRAVWTDLVTPVVEGLVDGCSLSSSYSKVLMYAFIGSVAFCPGRKHDTSLFDIATGLRNKNIVKRAASLELTVQLVFQVTGWLDAFWDPVLNVGGMETALCIRHPPEPSWRRIASSSRALEPTQLDIREARAELPKLLERFGSPLPLAEVPVRQDSLLDIEHGLEDISATYLSLHNLQQDLNVTIEWTMSQNDHLRYDERKHILYVFQLPSICYLQLLRQNGTFSSALSCAASDELERAAMSNSKAYVPIENHPGEVLLSYDLLFARSKSSRNSISRILQHEETKWRNEGTLDPLLRILCTKHRDCAEIGELHNMLDAHGLQDYIPTKEFPFLGSRLLNLQRLSKKLNPRWWRLWNDRRDIRTWFPMWAVVILGGGTLVLQLLSLAFQVVGLWLPLN